MGGGWRGSPRKGTGALTLSGPKTATAVDGPQDWPREPEQGLGQRMWGKNGHPEGCTPAAGSQGKAEGARTPSPKQESQPEPTEPGGSSSCPLVSRPQPGPTEDLEKHWPGCPGIRWVGDS